MHESRDEAQPSAVPDSNDVVDASEPGLSLDTTTSSSASLSQGPLARRRRLLLYFVAVAVVSAVLGWSASALVKSPAQVAADSAAPPPSIITDPVVRRVLQDAIVTRGSVVASRTIVVSPQVLAAGTGALPVVTRVPSHVGESVRSGQVILEVSGRPIYVLRGTIPAYRDLRPGEHGHDVAQLQADLAALGFSIGGDHSGTFGPGTEHGVVRFYDSIGYDVPSAGANGSSAYVPSSEVVFAPAFPVRIDSMNASVGSAVAADAVTLSTGALQVVSQLDPQSQSAVRIGEKVSMFSEVLNKGFNGTVSALSQTAPAGVSTDGGNAGTGGLYAVIAPSAPLGPQFANQDVRVSILAAATSGQVLVVPVTAISSGADGVTTVTVRRGSTLKKVAIDVGINGNGYVQVTPVGNAQLNPGDLVVVGVGQHP